MCPVCLLTFLGLSVPSGLLIFCFGKKIGARKK